MCQTLRYEITKRAKGIGFLAVEWQGVLVLIDLAGPFDPASDRELNIARNPRPRLAELDCRNARKRNALIALEAVIERTIGDGDGVIVDRDRFGLPFQRLPDDRSEEHTSELQSLMRISYAVFCLKKKKI